MASDQSPETQPFSRLKNSSLMAQAKTHTPRDPCFPRQAASEWCVLPATSLPVAANPMSMCARCLTHAQKSRELPAAPDNLPGFPAEPPLRHTTCDAQPKIGRVASSLSSEMQPLPGVYQVKGPATCHVKSTDLPGTPAPAFEPATLASAGRTPLRHTSPLRLLAMYPANQMLAVPTAVRTSKLD